jgi:LysM repeat protein
MPHVVKRGETLGKIATANGVTYQLLDANPQFRPRPDIIHVGAW